MFSTLSLYDEVMTGRPLVSVLYNITTFQNVVLTLVGVLMVLTKRGE